MTTVTNAILTDAELDGVTGGRAPDQGRDMWSPSVSQMNCIQYAGAYWSVGGLSTFGDFWYQLTN